MSIKSLSPKFLIKEQSFYLWLITCPFLQISILTQHEHTGDLSTKSISGGMGYRPRWMTKFYM